MIREIWKPIDDYPDYEVSNLGRVKSLKYGKERILKPISDKNVYLKVNLGKKMLRIHRLVAQAFIPNPNNLPYINHINENKTDNRVENLEWCTAQYNNEYSFAKSVLQLDKNGELVKKWDSTKKIRRELGLRPMENKTNICKGYEWGFETDYKKIKFNVFNLEIYDRII